jgi:hypothetical protein
MGGLWGGSATANVRGGKPHLRGVSAAPRETTQVGGYIGQGVRDLVLLRQEIGVSTPIDPQSTIVADQVFVHRTSHVAIEAESRGDVEGRAAGMASHMAPKGDRPDLAHLQTG